MQFQRQRIKILQTVLRWRRTIYIFAGGGILLSCYQEYDRDYCHLAATGPGYIGVQCDNDSTFPTFVACLETPVFYNCNIKEQLLFLKYFRNNVLKSEMSFWIFYDINRSNIISSNELISDWKFKHLTFNRLYCHFQNLLCRHNCVERKSWNRLVDFNIICFNEIRLWVGSRNKICSNACKVDIYARENHRIIKCLTVGLEKVNANSFI